MPRVSVIIPTYNRAGFIGEAIQSVLDQTCTDWELIVVDDGSTDETAQVVAQFGERVTYVYQDNAGVSAARNAGLATARGELVSFLDSDDRMLPHNLETLVVLLDAQPKVSVAYGWYYWMDIDGQPSSWQEPEILGEIPPQLDIPWPRDVLRPSGPAPEGQILAQLVLEETMLLGITLIRRACVEAIGGFDEAVQFQEHWDFYLRLAQAGCAYACSKQAVALLRLHPENRGQNKDEMLASRLAILGRLFGDPALEVTLADVRHQAYYNACIQFALDYFALGYFEQGVQCLNEALQYAPLHSNDSIKISEKMIPYVLAPEIKDPLMFARDLFETARQTIQMRRLRRKVLGRVNAELAFRHYHVKETSRVWRHALGAVMCDPSWLRNRGLVKIGLEGLVGMGPIAEVER
jgi:glycosyltransferase involved in cell wall biosynthesis